MKDRRIIQIFKQKHADVRPQPKVNVVEVRQPGQIKVNRLNKSISGQRSSTEKATPNTGSAENTFSAQQVEPAVMRPVEKTATKSKRHRTRKKKEIVKDKIEK